MDIRVKLKDHLKIGHPYTVNSPPISCIRRKLHEEDCTHQPHSPSGIPLESSHPTGEESMVVGNTDAWSDTSRP